MLVLAPQSSFVWILWNCINVVIVLSYNTFSCTFVFAVDYENDHKDEDAHDLDARAYTRC